MAKRKDTWIIILSRDGRFFACGNNTEYLRIPVKTFCIRNHLKEKDFGEYKMISIMERDAGSDNFIFIRGNKEDELIQQAIAISQHSSHKHKGKFAKWLRDNVVDLRKTIK